MNNVQLGQSLEYGDIWGLVEGTWRVRSGRLSEADPRKRLLSGEDGFNNGSGLQGSNRQGRS